jgi:nucleoside-diphosphate-sugar epimerase
VGSSGYLGAQLAKTFESSGVNVISISGQQFLSGDYQGTLKKFEKIDACVIAAGPSKEALSRDFTLGANYLKNLRILTLEKQLETSHLMYISTTHAIARHSNSQATGTTALYDYAHNRCEAESIFQAIPEFDFRKSIVIRLGNTFGLSEQFEQQRFQASGWKLAGNAMIRDAIFDGKIIIKDQTDTGRNFISLGSATGQIVNILLNIENFINTSIIHYVQGEQKIFLIDLARYISNYTSVFTSNPILILSNFSLPFTSMAEEMSGPIQLGSHLSNAIKELVEWTFYNA